MFEAPNISESLSRSFLQQFNVLLLHSRSLELSRAISLALIVQSQNPKKRSSLAHVTIITDVNQSMMEEINYHLHYYRERKILNKEIYQYLPKQICALHKTNKDKREKLYLEGGVFTISINILLLDLMTGTLNANQLRRLVIFHRGALQGKISDKYCSLPWVSTLLAINAKQVPIVLVSKQTHLFQNQNLENVVRLMFIKKVVIWPFGRSQIQQSLKKFNMKKVNHKMLMHQSEKQLLSLYRKLIEISQPRRNSSNKNQRLDKIQFHSNVSDIRNLEFLQQSLLLYSKIEHLIHLELTIAEGKTVSGSVWNSNSMTVIEIIDKINKIVPQLVYTLTHQQNKKQIIDLEKLMSKYTKTKRIQQIDKKQENQCFIDNNDEEKLDSDYFSQSESNHESCSNLSSHKISERTKCVFYELEFEIRVYGLQILDKQLSPAFSPKFMEIAKYFENRHLKYQRDNQEKDDQQDNFQHKLAVNSNDLITPKMQTQDNEARVQIEIENSQSLKSGLKQSKSKQTSRFSEQNIQFGKYQFQNIKQKVERKGQKQEQISQSGKVSSLIKDSTRSDHRKIIKLSDILHEADNRIKQQTVYLQTISRDSEKNLRRQIFLYENNNYYRFFIRQLTRYLELTKFNRITIIKRLIRRLQRQGTERKTKNGQYKKIPLNPKSHFISINRKQQEAVLLEEVYQEIQSVEEILTHYEKAQNIDGHQQVDQLFKEEIKIMRENRQKNYVNSEAISISTRQFNQLDDSVLNYNDHRVVFHVHSGQNLSLLSRNMRIICPDICVFHHPSPEMARFLVLEHASGNLNTVRQTHAIYFDDSFETELLDKSIVQEDKAFWNVGQIRQNLGEYVEDPHIRIEELFIDDNISKKQKMVNIAMNMDKEKISAAIKVTRTILVDKRQFKSMLPSYLFHHGFEVIPVFLEVGDYILSNTLAIQKKSVQTRDLHQSMRSGRLADQLRRMCIKFTKPYLLIECSDISYFSKSELNFGINNTNGEKYQMHIRRQLIKLMNQFPKVQVLWSLGYLQSIEMIIELKKNELEPQLNKFKPVSEADEIDDFSDDEQKQKKIGKKIASIGSFGDLKKNKTSKDKLSIKKIQQSKFQDEEMYE